MISNFSHWDVVGIAFFLPKLPNVLSKYNHVVTTTSYEIEPKMSILKETVIDCFHIR